MLKQRKKHTFNEIFSLKIPNVLLIHTLGALSVKT